MPSYRFQIGDRVECNMGHGTGGWKPGTIVKHNHREEDFPPGLTMPYQVRLDIVKDEDNLIFVPRDANDCVRLRAVDKIFDDGEAGYDSFGDDSDIDDTFELPPQPDCPVCFIPLQNDGYGEMHRIFAQCCGKTICMGCWMQSSIVGRERGLDNVECNRCAFCRAPPYQSNQELTDALKTLSDRGNADALAQLGYYHDQGIHGFKKDMKKALDLQHQAAKMGNSMAAFNLACRYRDGNEVKLNKTKAKRLFKRAAKFGGRVDALSSLAQLVLREDNEPFALRLWIIAASAGDTKALRHANMGVQRGIITEDEYEKASLSCYDAQIKTQSVNRHIGEGHGPSVFCDGSEM